MGTYTQTLEGHSGTTLAAVSPDFKLTASLLLDNTVKIWDVATGLCTQTLRGHSGYVHGDR